MRLRQQQTRYVTHLDNLTQIWGGTDNRIVTMRAEWWPAARAEQTTQRVADTCLYHAVSATALRHVKAIPDTAPRGQHADRRSGWTPQEREDLDDPCHDTRYRDHRCDVGYVIPHNQRTVRHHLLGQRCIHNQQHSAPRVPVVLHHCVDVHLTGRDTRYGNKHPGKLQSRLQTPHSIEAKN